MTDKPARRLTTIFYADAVGYGAQMTANEDRALLSLKLYRELMRDRFNKYGGRLVNTWGDAVIAEFSSVVEAVRCAVDIQDSISQMESGTDVSMAFRIGINLGDVMVDGNDLYGDGVNIAARLEAMAPAGGILVSRPVYEFAHKQLALRFQDEGLRAAKDGEDGISTYSIHVGNKTDMSGNGSGASEPPGKALPYPPVETADVPSGLIGRLFNQPKRVQFALGMIAFLFLINLMSTGLNPPWFLYPTGGLLLMILLSSRSGKK